MQKIILSLVMLGGLAGSATAMPTSSEPNVSAVTPVDWYCGPRCQQHRAWRSQHDPYYGYRGATPQRYSAPPRYYGYGY